MNDAQHQQVQTRPLGCKSHTFFFVLAMSVSLPRYLEYRRACLPP